MSITDTVIENLDKVQEQTLSLIDSGQSTAMKAIEAAVDFVTENGPNVELDADYVGLPGAVADKGFAFAEQVLGTTRLFVADVFAKIEPVVTASPVVEVVKDSDAA